MLYYLNSLNGTKDEIGFLGGLNLFLDDSNFSCSTIRALSMSKKHTQIVTFSQSKSKERTKNQDHLESCQIMYEYISIS